MNFFAIFTAGLVIVPAIVLVAWALYAMVQIEEDLLSFCTFESTHFEV